MISTGCICCQQVSNVWQSNTSSGIIKILQNVYAVKKLERKKYKLKSCLLLRAINTHHGQVAIAGIQLHVDLAVDACLALRVVVLADLRHLWQLNGRLKLLSSRLLMRSDGFVGPQTMEIRSERLVTDGTSRKKWRTCVGCPYVPWRSKANDNYTANGWPPLYTPGGVTSWTSHVAQDNYRVEELAYTFPFRTTSGQSVVACFRSLITRAKPRSWRLVQGRVDDVLVKCLDLLFTCHPSHMLTGSIATCKTAMCVRYM